ncbi:MULTISPECIES: MlaD family protein [unclassified Mycobacterium]|uniref:MlaD family protein n=1 Tax=unclassified Mycobacterium TaxID=2642494 RepID=UPI0029C7DB9A|nr:MULTISPECIES: MCE family protein [unclassified Mycobacterium]
MPNSFDYETRGPSDGRLLIAGVSFLLIASAIAMVLIAKYQGKLDPFVRVSAEMVDVGDGLPAKSDVKFRGVLVGSVSDVVAGQAEQPSVVHIDLKPAYASGIPNNVTARVVPSNVFAVSSVQLVDNGNGSAPLQAGAVIPEDQKLPTVLYQTLLTKLRAVLAAFGREPSVDNIGWVTALGEATEGRGDRLEDAGRDLNKIVVQLNSVVGTDTGPSTISALADAANGLREADPELFDALNSAVKPMRTLAEKRAELTDFLSAGQRTLATLGDGFDKQTDRLINITTQMTPFLGVVADRADQFHTTAGRFESFAYDALRNVWHDDINMFFLKGTISLTPTRTYVRADCARYGALESPSCKTAPEVPVAPSLSSALESRGLPMPPGVSENRPNLAPPRGSVLPPQADSGPPPPPEAPPAPEVPPPPLLPAELPLPDQSETPPQPAAQLPVQPQSAIIGGNVGPVGSPQEKDQLGVLVGGQANSATELLLGPLARGTTVVLGPDPGGTP